MAGQPGASLTKASQHRQRFKRNSCQDRRGTGVPSARRKVAASNGTECSWQGVAVRQTFGR